MVSTISVSVRNSTSSDLDFLAHAHRCGNVAIENDRGGRLDILMRGRAEPIEDSFADTQADPIQHVFIGDIDDVPVGYLVVEIVRLRTDELVARVNDLWVHESARGVGLGAALMNQAVEIAVEQGCTGIDARALPGDRITKNFFESFGLVARTIEVHKSL